MCYNCGCFIPHDDMGDSRNITESTFKHIAEKKHLSVDEIKRKLYHELAEDQPLDPEFKVMFEEASDAWGQSIPEAKKETKKLLARQLKTK